MTSQQSRSTSTQIKQRITKSLLGLFLLLASTYSYGATVYETAFSVNPKAATPEAACQRFLDNQTAANHIGAVGFLDWTVLLAEGDFDCKYHTDVEPNYHGELGESTKRIYDFQGVCPTGTIDNGVGTCVVSYKADSKQPTAKSCPATAAGPNPMEGNPIVVATGNKFQTEVDYQSQSPFGLSFVRYYSSTSNLIDNGVGTKWQHRYQQRINISAIQVQVSRSNDQTFIYTFDGSNWISDIDVSETLTETLNNEGYRTGWRYTTSNDTVETYNAIGQLLQITNRAGQSKTFTYTLTIDAGGDNNSATLDKITGFSGESLLLHYDETDTLHPNRIISFTDPEGNEYTYSYDAIGNITSVTLPDETPLDLNDNPTRSYHYENVTFPHHLTGRTDETGSRVTWAFDSEGRAISSELDGGVDKGTLVYHQDGSVTTTNPLGKDTTYHFTTLHGVKKVTQVEGHATSSCAGANQNYTYDTNGYLTSKTDWQGHITTFNHDARGLELSRTEASGTPEARTITTQWHTTFRLPIKITAPGQVTDFTYDAQGRLLSQTSHTP